MPSPAIRIATSSPALLAGLDRIRADFAIPHDFPAPVTDAAARAAASGADPSVERLDARDVDFVTIDPKGSHDLDQAFFAERRGDGFRVQYAIADVAAFVTAGDALDVEAHARGVTLYLPDRRALLYPPTLSEGAASLLATDDRPALLWTIDLDRDGAPSEWRLQRALVRSRRALSYREVQDTLDRGDADESLTLLREVGRLREAQERARGGVSLAVPTQEVTRGGKGFRLAFDVTLPVEGWNAQISLLAGICAAAVMLDAGVGILRTLPAPDEHTLGRLQRTARALGIDWPAGRSYADVVHALRPDQPGHAAFVTQAVQTLRGAGYTLVGAAPGPPPVHGALATTYAHVTAPLRRLADRFANEVVVAHCAGRSVPAWVSDALPSLPATMAETGRRAAGVERAVIDLVEAIVLVDRIGEILPATVVDIDDGHATVLVPSPPVIARLDGDGLVLGAEVQVRVAAADPTQRRVEFARVGVP
jgi:exoribonuclease R